MNLTVLPPADANANGLPDYWEAIFGALNPDNDADGDGMTTLQEYFANTNPTNALSRLRIAGVSVNAVGQAAFTWAAVGGTRYRVSYSDADGNGSFTGVFTDIVRAVAVEMDSAEVGTTSTQAFTDDFTLTGGPPANGARYYRVQVVE